MDQLKQKVLIVEDDTEIRELIRLYLERESLEVWESVDAESAILLIKDNIFDLIILDIMLPGQSGLDLCKDIRISSTTPIILVTARGDSEDVIEGLGLGADDYVTKPFDPLVVVARAKAAMRRAGSEQREDHRPVFANKVWTDGRLHLNFDTLELHIHGELVMLYAKELQLLLYFLRNPERVLSVNHLFEKVWGWDAESDDRTVMVHISNLRRKIEIDPATPQYIKTVRGFGYKFSRPF